MRWGLLLQASISVTIAAVGLWLWRRHRRPKGRAPFAFQGLYDTAIDNAELWRPPTLDEISPASPFVSRRLVSPPTVPFPFTLSAAGQRTAEYAMHRERAVAYGRLIGCTDEEIERTIETHRKLEVTTPYQLDWNRIEADLRAIRFPSATLHRTFAEEDDRRGNADVQLRPE